MTYGSRVIALASLIIMACASQAGCIWLSASALFTLWMVAVVNIYNDRGNG